MKKLVLIFVVSFLVCSLYGQKAMSFEEAAKQGITTKSLDSIYISAINVINDESGNYIYENEEEVMEAWYKMFEDISIFLWKTEEMKEVEIRIFQRVYFNKDGKIDYYLYKIQNHNEITEEQALQVANSLNEFVKEYQFSFSAIKDFVQCGVAKFAAK